MLKRQDRTIKDKERVNKSILVRQRIQYNTLKRYSILNILLLKIRIHVS